MACTECRMVHGQHEKHCKFHRHLEDFVLLYESHATCIRKERELERCIKELEADKRELLRIIEESGEGEPEVEGVK